jgi:hypothetical protein
MYVCMYVCGYFITIAIKAHGDHEPVQDSVGYD